MNKIWTGILGENIRIFLAETTDMIKKATEIHQTSEVSSVALGRTLTAASILGKTLKNDQDVLTLKISGTTEIKTILATSNALGNVKGYISNPDAELLLQSDKTKIGKAIGLGGSITLIRDYGLKEPYIGLSHLISGEIDEDIAFYFKNSEQQPTWMALDCTLEGSKIKGAGGLFVQSMPDISPEEKMIFLEAEEKMNDFFIELYNGEKPEVLLKKLFSNLNLHMTGEFEVDFSCDCSRKRISRALLTLGKEDLKNILDEDGFADISCHFCNSNYHFDEEDIKALIEITNG